MDLPTQVAVMTLPNATLFPQALLPLYIFEPRYRQMVADALRSHRMFAVAMQRLGRKRETPCGVAGLGLIRVSVDHQDGTSHLILQGITRVALGRPVRYKPYRVQRIRPLQAPVTDNVVVDALLAKVRELVERRMALGPSPFPFSVVKAGAQCAEPKPPAFSAKQVLDYLDGLPGADQVADLVSCALLPDARARQTILETVEIETRLKVLIRFLLCELSRTAPRHST